jgi:hypothetical protein
MYHAKNRFAVLLFLALVWTGQGSFGQSISQTESLSPSENAIVLFNGTSLDGFDTWLKDSKNEGPRHVFGITNGMLHISGDGFGALITRDSFRNYHLVLEYKWGEHTWHERKSSARDSGLLINSTGKLGGYDGTWIPSIEVQIIEGGVGDFVFVPGDDENGTPIPLALTSTVDRDRDGETIWSEKGERKRLSANDVGRVNWYGRDPDWADTIGFRGTQDKDSKLGLWTRIDVISEEGHVQVYVNGVKVNEAFDVSPREGRIQLQSELAELFVRRWELWPVDKGPAIAPANQ